MNVVQIAEFDWLMGWHLVKIFVRYYKIFFPWGYLDFVTEIFIKLSSVFHMTSVHIDEFDWLPGQ